MFKSFFACNNSNISKNIFIWNLIACTINACESVILVAMVSRVVDIDSAGIITIALAISNLFLNIGKYSIRGYQTTDVKKQFPFNTYFSFRIITVLIMIITLFAFIGIKIAIGEYSISKAIIILLLCLIYSIEAMEDVFLGHYQFLNRLDVASKVFTVRWISIFLVFCLTLVLLHNLVFSLLFALFFSLVLDFILIHEANDYLCIKNISFNIKQLNKIATQCFPLFASTFLFFYVTTAPKLSIDSLLTEKDQACFGVISMPIFIIDLLSSFLYQPQLVKMSEEWKQKRIQSFKKRIILQIVYIFLITLCSIIFAYTYGCNILSVIFNIDILPYKLEFTMLMLASGEFALLAYSSMILAIMRKQIIHFGGIALIATLSAIGFNTITMRFGITGIVIYYTILVAIPVLINLVSITILIQIKQK